MNLQQRAVNNNNGGLVDRPFAVGEFDAKLATFKVVRDRRARPKANVFLQSATTTTTATTKTTKATKEIPVVVKSTTSSSSSSTTSTQQQAQSREERLRTFLLSKLDNDEALVDRVCTEFNKL
jgi:hypothetical protein